MNHNIHYRWFGSFHKKEIFILFLVKYVTDSNLLRVMQTKNTSIVTLNIFFFVNEYAYIKNRCNSIVKPPLCYPIE